MRGLQSMNRKKLLSFKETGAKLCLLLGAAILSLSVSTQSFAQPTSPCDPEYMDALEARAWMEAQREITQNQNFIFKPDSVLEYTCFDSFLNEAASNFGDRQFSETTHWGDSTPNGFAADSTDDALEAVVLDPLNAYLNANFTTIGINMGDYLNNRPNTAIARTAATEVNGGTAYACAEMQQVWRAARCMDFNDEENYDGFYDFLWYQVNDPRREDNDWVPVCVRDDRMTAARTTAFNGDQALFEISASDEILAAQGNGTPYQEDDVITHLDRILPGTCTGTAIPTGISVERPDVNGGNPYPERVCPNPGCTAAPGSATCSP